MQGGCYGNTGGAAAESKHAVLDQQLSSDPKASRAKGATNRHLARPRHRPCQLKTGDVGRSGGEQQADGDQQHDQGTPHVARERLAQRRGRDAYGSAGAEDGAHGHLEVVRRRCGEGTSCGLVARLRYGGPRPEAGDRLEHRHQAAGGGVHPERHPRERVAIGVCGAIRQDADDPMRPALELDRPSQRRRVAAKPPAPESLGENDHVAALRCFVRVLEQGSCEGVHRKRSEQARRRGHRANARRLADPGQRELARRPGGDLLDRRWLLAPRQICGVAE